MLVLEFLKPIDSKRYDDVIGIGTGIVREQESVLTKILCDLANVSRGWGVTALRRSTDIVDDAVFFFRCQSLKTAM
ncbi:hypothetical protein TREMEDRAFT_68302 [Tremella mesenterica DSM 1558]|uniref:uncharacterized protein n=1 Tax=Tremella mesenterica (strain ATCC 24925 / CBS 8224 / DSM 1558 / NBRC 9311 / NRRL Y-6157 / RJB 2259-6 / UBC 559-6) TaxID=578456 RepID=UPI0003F48D73|nr:uncharacterized protein TREMEDRAFT_68302 [Tremella mesenterica DSM 1558]EIW69779.1 hypothetical protein TREMEDRAFT_68302 [Tremella mesenterica DSM 1558]